MTYTIEQIKELCESIRQSPPIATILKTGDVFNAIIPELVAEVEMLRGKLHAFKAAAQIVVDSHQMSCLGEDCQISGIDMLKYQLRHS